MSRSRAPLVCSSPNMVLKKNRGTVTWDVWSSLGGTLMGLRGLGKSTMSPATLFTMGCRGGRRGAADLRAAHSPGSDSASPSWPPLGPHPPPVVGRALVGTYIDIQLYVLVGDERQCGQSEFHGPKSPKGHQAWMRRGGKRKAP